MNSNQYRTRTLSQQNRNNYPYTHTHTRKTENIAAHDRHTNRVHARFAVRSQPLSLWAINSKSRSRSRSAHHTASSRAIARRSTSIRTTRKWTCQCNYIAVYAKSTCPLDNALVCVMFGRRRGNVVPRLWQVVLQIPSRPFIVALINRPYQSSNWMSQTKTWKQALPFQYKYFSVIWFSSRWTTLLWLFRILFCFI